MAPSQLDGEASSRGRTDEPHLVFDSLDLDLGRCLSSPSLSATSSSSRSSSLNPLLVIKVLSKTIFSPFFTIFLPLTFLAQVRSTSHPAFIVSCTWTAIVCIFGEHDSVREACGRADCCTGALRHADRVYANQASWILAPPKLDWGDQIVLITGGERVFSSTYSLFFPVLTASPPVVRAHQSKLFTLRALQRTFESSRVASGSLTPRQVVPASAPYSPKH